MKLNAQKNAENIGTHGRTRTGTSARTGDFESPASTIPPHGHNRVSAIDAFNCQCK